jgi:hypothetical protein
MKITNSRGGVRTISCSTETVEKCHIRDIRKVLLTITSSANLHERVEPVIPQEICQKNQGILPGCESLFEPIWFFTARKLIVLDVRPKCHKYNQQYSVNYIFPGLKMANPVFIIGCQCTLGWCTWKIQSFTMDWRWRRNSWSITSPDFRTRPIR